MKALNKLAKKDNRTVRENIIYPPWTWFFDDFTSFYKRKRNKRLKNNCKVVVLTHNDLDGKVCGSLFRKHFDDPAILPIDYESMEAELGYIKRNYIDDVEKVFASDLKLEADFEVIEEIEEEVDEFHWYDHHEWSDEDINKMEDIGVNLVIDQDECGASLVMDELESMGSTFDDDTEYIVDITKDRDLWIRDCDTVKLGGEEKHVSDILSTYEFMIRVEKDELHFLDNILEEGKGFWKDEDTKEKISEKIQEERKKLEIVKTDYTDIREIKGYRVAFCYGRCSPSDLSEELKEEKGADIVALVRPKGKISIRSRENVFEKCHLVGEKLDGGGHPCAAGCYPDDAFEGMDQLVTLWSDSHGERLHNMVEEKLIEVIEEEN